MLQKDIIESARKAEIQKHPEIADLREVFLKDIDNRRKQFQEYQKKCESQAGSESVSRP